MAMAFHYSGDARGKWTEPDSWFLLQSSSLQFCGLLITGLTLPKDTSRWAWVPIAAALACTLLGPVLYCFVPTQFAILSNTLAGVVQAFVILQGSLAESRN
jgi:hypothetical protein